MPRAGKPRACRRRRKGIGTPWHRNVQSQTSPPAIHKAIVASSFSRSVLAAAAGSVSARARLEPGGPSNVRRRGAFYGVLLKSKIFVFETKRPGLTGAGRAGRWTPKRNWTHVVVGGAPREPASAEPSLAPGTRRGPRAGAGPVSRGRAERSPRRAISSRGWRPGSYAPRGGSTVDEAGVPQVACRVSCNSLDPFLP